MSALVAPAASYLNSTPTIITVGWTSASGGTAPYVYDVHRSTTSGFTPSVDTLLSAGESTPYADNAAALIANTFYYYKIVVTDSAGSPATATSNEASGSLAFGGAASAAAMTLATARELVRDWARNAGDTTMYPAARVDRAIQSIGNEFCRKTRSVRDSLEIALADGADSVTVDFGVAVMPENLTDLTWDDQEEPIIVLGYVAFNAVRAADPDAEGPPTHATIVENAAAATAGTFEVLLWPTNDDTRTITIRAWLNFTQWTPGVSDNSAAAITLNLPYAWLTQFLPSGGASKLQFNEPEHGYAEKARREYEQLERGFAGAGNLADRSIRRRSLRDLESGAI